MISETANYDGFNLTFNVTEDCNLQCKYCYELNKRPRDLPLEYAEKFIDIILDDPDPINVLNTDSQWIIEQGLTLDFIGGDALMRPKLVDDILKYYMYASGIREHKWANRWRASISTNGTLFGESEVQALLFKYHDNLSIGVSVDGCPEIHNHNRSNSMDKILKWWDFYLGYAGENASTKSTLNKEAIPYIYKSVKYLHEDLKLRHINMNFIFEDMGLEESDLIELEKQLEKTADYVLQHKNDLFLSLLGKRSIGDKMTDQNTNWCGSGSMPALSPNGKIYPCFRFMPHTMSDSKFDFYVGDVWNGFNHKERFDLVKKQTRGEISEDKCKDCSIESSCAWCVAGAFSECGKFYRQTYICEVHKIQSKWAEIYWREYDRSTS